jgi:hypothetical protein
MNIPPPDYQVYRVRLKNILKNDTSFMSIINNAIYRENILMHNVSMFIRAYLLHKYDLTFNKNKNINDIKFTIINSFFVDCCIDILTLKVNTNYEEKKDEKEDNNDENELLEFYNNFYKKFHYDIVNIKNMSKIIEESVKMFIVNIENNINLHFTKYVKKYLKIFFEKYIKENVIEDLIKNTKKFNKTLHEITNIILDNKDYLTYKYKNFIDIHKNNITPNNLNDVLNINPQSLIKYQIYMLKALENLNLNVKLYQFLPLKSHTKTHIHINNNAFVDLFYKNNKIIYPESDEKFKQKNNFITPSDLTSSSKPYKKMLWDLFFKFEHKIFKNKEFAYSFSTNGYEICLKMIHKKNSEKIKKSKKSKFEGRLKSINDVKTLSNEEKQNYFKDKSNIRDDKEKKIKVNKKNNIIKYKNNYSKEINIIKKKYIDEEKNNLLLINKQNYNPYLQIFLNSYVHELNNLKCNSINETLMNNSNYENIDKLLCTKIIKDIEDFKLKLLDFKINKTKELNDFIFKVIEKNFNDEGIILDKFLENTIYDIKTKLKIELYKFNNSKDTLDVKKLYEEYETNKKDFEKILNDIKINIKKHKIKNIKIKNTKIKNIDNLILNRLKNTFIKYNKYIENFNIFKVKSNLEGLIRYSDKFNDDLIKINETKINNIDFKNIKTENNISYMNKLKIALIMNNILKSMKTKINVIRKKIIKPVIIKGVKHVKNINILNEEKDLLNTTYAIDINYNSLKKIFMDDCKKYFYIDDLTDKRLEILNNLNWVVIDPGKKTLLTMRSKDGIMFKYSTKQKMYETKRLIYTKKLEKIKLKNGIKKIETKISEYSSKTCDLDKFLKYVKIINKNLITLRDKYNEKEKLYRFRSNSYINKRRSNDRLVNKIKKKFGKNVVLIYGDWSNKASMNLISTPNNEIKTLLTKNFITLNIDEYNTSKLDYIYENECVNYELKTKIVSQKRFKNYKKINKTYKNIKIKIDNEQKKVNKDENYIKVLEDFKIKKEKTIERIEYSKINGILIFKQNKKDDVNKIEKSGCLNRDVNAVKNMEKIVKHYINSNSRLKNFRRDTLKVLKVSNHENGEILTIS